MAIRFGSTVIAALMLGTATISRVYSGSDLVFGEAPDPGEVAYETKRYWRVRFTNGWSSDRISLASVDFLDSTGAVIPTTGGVASADSFFDATTTPERAFDQNAATYWHSSVAPNSGTTRYLAYDYGAGNAKEVAGVQLTTRSNFHSQAPVDGWLEHSGDGVTWTPYLQWTLNYTGAQTTRAFMKTQAKTPSTAVRWRVRVPTTQPAGNPSALGCQELEMRTTPGGADVTTGVTAYASYIESGSSAANAVNNAASAWTTGAFSKPAGGHWLETEFSAPPGAIQQITWRSRNDQYYAEFPLSVAVEYHDGTQWQTHWSLSGVGTVGQSQTRVITDPSVTLVDSRWRIKINATINTGAWATLNEIQMRAVAGGPDLTAPMGPVFVSHASAATNRENLFDDNNATVWQSGGTARPVTIEYDFGGPRDIVEVVMRTQTAGDAPSNFDIEKWDGSAWVTVWSVPATGAWTANVDRVFTKP